MKIFNHFCSELFWGKEFCRRILILFCLFAEFKFIEGDPHEYRLYKDLLDGLNYLERPVANHTKPVTVKLQVVLQQIVDVDEQNQILEINAWLLFDWKDYKLNWNPDDYGGVTDVRFPVGKTWKPDVLLYNSVDSNFDSTYQSNLVVYSDGTINWIPPGIFKISCKIDITWFPFDEQNCYLKFGSWTYNGLALDLQPNAIGVDTSEYIQNGEWSLLNTPVFRSEKFYECCPEPYPDLKFYLIIRRRTLYYGFNLIIPSLLICLMTILGFTLPPDAGEKITLEITILLSVCFFLSMVASMTPPTSEAVPLIGTFFTCCMLVVSASVVCTVLVLNLHYRTPDTHEMADITKTILLKWLPWILMMQRPGHTFTRASLLKSSSKKEESPEKEKKKEKEKDKDKDIKETSAFLPKDSLLNVENGIHSHPPPAGGHHFGQFLDPEDGVPPHLQHLHDPLHDPHRRSSAVEEHRRESISLENRINQCIVPMLSHPSMVDPGVHALILMMQRIHTELKFITRRMEKEDEDSDAENDWKFAAMVVDRLCLVIFSAFIVASTCGIMFSAPYLIA